MVLLLNSHVAPVALPERPTCTDWSSEVTKVPLTAVHVVTASSMDGSNRRLTRLGWQMIVTERGSR